MSIGVVLNWGLWNIGSSPAALSVFTGPLATLIAADVGADVVVLAEIQPMEPLSVWTAVGGSFPNVYWTVFTPQIATDVIRGGIYRRLDEVRQDATQLTSRASVNECNISPGSYYYDEANGILNISTTTGFHPDTYALIGAWFTLFFSTSSIQFSDYPMHSPLLTGTLPTFSSEMPDPLFGSIISASGAIEIVNTDRLFDKLSRRYVWRNKTVTLKLGSRALAGYIYFETFETLVINGITVDDEIAMLQLENEGNVLNQSLPLRTWGDGLSIGSNPTDPTQGINGLSQPIIFGQVYVVPAVFAGTSGGVEVWNIADINTEGYGAYSITEAYWVDRSVRSGSQLLSGEWAFSGGQIHVLNPTYSHDAYDIVANILNAGTLPNPSFGTMALAILRLCGESNDRIDVSAFNAADVEAPQILARYLGEPRMAADVMMELCQSVNGQVYKDHLGRWTCRLIRPDIPLTDYVTITDADIASWIPREELATVLNEVRVRHSHRPYLDDWIEATSSDDRTKYANETSDSHRLDTWLTTAYDGSVQAAHLQFFRSEPGMTIESEQRGLALLRARAGDVVAVIRSRGPIARTGALEGQIMRIVKIEKSLGPDVPVVKVWLNDLEGQTDRIGRCLDASVDVDWNAATPEQRALYGFCSDADGYLGNVPLDGRYLKVAY